MRGPTSSPIQPSGTSTPSLSRRSVAASKLSPSTRSTGSISSQAEPSARSSASAASFTPSSSTSESPVAIPCARKKLKHIAPPIRMLSATSRKRSMTPILSLTLAPPRTTTSGRSGDSTTARQLVHLALEQQAGVAGQAVGDPLGAGVGAVGGAEGVVDVEVGEPGQRVGQLRIVLGLARLEADVLEQQHVARAQPGGHRLDLLADHRRRLLHLGAEQLGQALADRPHRERRVDLALRPAEVGDEDQRGAALAQQLDRRQRRADPRVVGDPAAVERHVEVDPDQHPLAGDVGVADALPWRSSRRPPAAAQRTLPASSTQRFE